MYIETIPRKLGGLARHLLHTGRGSNERVIVRSELSRDMPADVELGLRLLAAPARRIRRMKRDVVHVVMAPERQLPRDEVERVLQLYEAEYGISSSNARLVVEHVKGDRASHFHTVYSMASEAEGKALRFTRSADRDEMLARRLEIELGMKLQPSTRVDRTVELLRERGLADLAELAAEGPRSEKGRNRPKAERQQARRVEANHELIETRLMRAWRQCGGELNRLPEHLRQHGLELAAGRKRIAGVPIVLVVDEETLFAGSLTHILNRVRKANGELVRIREPAMGAAVGELKPEREVKAQLGKTASERAAQAVLGEYDRLVAEMEADGEREAAIKAKRVRDRLVAGLSTEEKGELQARRRIVRERYRQRDRIRRARVNRAFLMAKLFGNRGVRKTAFYLVAVGMLATGTGLLAALAAAGVVLTALPSFRSAKRLRHAAHEAARQDGIELALELQNETRRFFRNRAHRQKAIHDKERARQTRMRIHRNRKQNVLGSGSPRSGPPTPAAQRRAPARRPGPER